MAVGDIGRRLGEARELTRPVITQGSLARMLGVSQPRLSNWERGKHDPPSEVIVVAARVLKRPVAYFYGEDDESSVDSQTDVHYNEGDSNRSPSDETLDLIAAISDPRTIRIQAPIIEGAAVWSLKGARRQTMNLFAYLAAGSTPVKLADHSPSLNFPSGTLLLFQDDDYPRTDVYLLIQSKADPDLHAIRYLESADPLSLKAEDAASVPLKLTEWAVAGFCIAEVQGASSSAPRVIIRPDGIGPNRR
jgi:transcriptional regulator with XRE-family HTH domain